MSTRSERLQEAIGLVADEFVEEAHAAVEGDAVEGDAASAGGTGAGASAGGTGAGAGGTGAGAGGAGADTGGTGASAGAGAGAGADDTAAVTDGAEAVDAGAPDSADPSTKEAKPQAKRGNLRKRALAVAACLVVVIGVGFLAFGALQPAASPATDRLESAESAESAKRMKVEALTADSAAEIAMDSAMVESAAGAADAVSAARAAGSLATGMSPALGGDVDEDATFADEEGFSIVEKLYDEDGLYDGEDELYDDEEFPIAEELYDDEEFPIVEELYDEDGLYDEGEAFVLTAAEWNDNANWPFFMNLVNAGTIGFPSFGIDPRNRVKVTVTDADGNPLRGEKVVLADAAGEPLWHAESGKDGVAYLFYRDGDQPASVEAGGATQALTARASGADGQQGSPVARRLDDVTVVAGSPKATGVDGLQVMFIVDTTGSMSDEIAYLQKDFASIAAEVGSDGVSYSANFYRDEGSDEEYVTKCNDFTSDVAQVQGQLNDEYADGGGDEPEAVAQILAETITDNRQWRDDAAKIAFLVFDAPPHDGTDATIEAAVESAAERGIRIVPVVSSNADRDTELFGRALAICTNGTYVFLTDDSGVGGEHLEPIVGDYDVELLHDVIVRLIQNAR